MLSSTTTTASVRPSVQLMPETMPDFATTRIARARIVLRISQGKGFVLGHAGDVVRAGGKRESRVVKDEQIRAKAGCLANEI
ncbi:MAG: hypothetical protein QM805_22490 [Pseudomonas sp.]